LSLKSRTCKLDGHANPSFSRKKIRTCHYMYSLRTRNLSNDDNIPRGHKFKLLILKSRISKDISFDISNNIYTYMIRGSTSIYTYYEFFIFFFLNGKYIYINSGSQNTNQDILWIDLVVISLCCKIKLLREERPLRADAMSMSLKMFPEKSRISKDLSFDISSNIRGWFYY
jgi:hypothetical protein